MFRERARLAIVGLISIVGVIAISGCDIQVLYPSAYEDTTIENDTLLAVVTPEGTEAYSPADVVPIQWSGSIDSPTVVIDLYRYGQFAMQIASRAANTGSFNWLIPVDFDAVSEVTDHYQIAIRAQHPDYSPGDLFVQAFSEPFTIVPQASGGLSDVTVSQRIITITMTDNGQEIDDDTVDIILNGATISAAHVLVGPPGTNLELTLQAGINLLEVVALNEGAISPNTAELIISHVLEGESIQEWRLATSESGSLTITAP
ncbi:MAG: hypothetical protein KOO61_03755 [Spirochaetales bacterium]|nr:hypothetical protein [Spirochaetales bacterium]